MVLVRRATSEGSHGGVLNEASLTDNSLGSRKVVLGPPWPALLLWDCFVLSATGGDQNSKNPSLCSLANHVKS